MKYEFVKVFMPVVGWMERLTIRFSCGEIIFHLRHCGSRAFPAVNRRPASGVCRRMENSQLLLINIHSLTRLFPITTINVIQSGDVASTMRVLQTTAQEAGLALNYMTRADKAPRECMSSIEHIVMTSIRGF
jgi:hypothetical protein